MEYISNPTPFSTTYRVAVCAGDGFSDWDYFIYAMDLLLQNKVAAGIPIEIVYGACKAFEDTSNVRPNVDQLALRYAKQKGYIATSVRLNNLYGEAAIPLRYATMRAYSNGIVAFWNRKDKTIKQMIKLSEKEGLAVRVAYWYYHEPKKLLTA